MKCPFIAYRDIIGKPGEGIHAYKFKGTSIIDFIVTIAGAFLLTYLTDIPLVLTTIGLLILGIFLHILFGVPTHVVRFMKLGCSQ